MLAQFPRLLASPVVLAGGRRILGGNTFRSPTLLRTYLVHHKNKGRWRRENKNKNKKVENLMPVGRALTYNVCDGRPNAVDYHIDVVSPRHAKSLEQRDTTQRNAVGTISVVNGSMYVMNRSRLRFSLHLGSSTTLVGIS